MVWYSHLFQNFPQFIVIHTVKGIGIVNKAEIDIFLELSCFFNDPVDVGNLISGSSAFSKTSFFMVLLKYSLAERSYLTIVFKISFPPQRKANPPNVQTTTKLHPSQKVMLKIFQATLQQYMNHELPDIQAGFRKGNF